MGVEYVEHEALNIVPMRLLGGKRSFRSIRHG